PQFLREVAAGYERIAGLQGRFTGAGILDSRAALENYRKAFEIRSSLVKRFPQSVDDAKAKIALSRAYIRGLLLAAKVEKARQVARPGVDLAADFRSRDPQDPAAIAAQGAAHVSL